MAYANGQSCDHSAGFTKAEFKWDSTTPLTYERHLATAPEIYRGGIMSLIPSRSFDIAGSAAAFISVLCLMAFSLGSQAPVTRDTVRHAGETASRRYPPGIQDNSFLIEEAYNQDPGVVQHISQFQQDLGGAGFDFLFTQEWPVGGITHQLSYSIPITRPGASEGAGMGDVRLNYRYQLVGDGEAIFAIAPRLTLILPTGDFHRSRGAGATGYEVWLPASLVLSEKLIAHGNAGLTLTPRARDPEGDRATTHTWTFGGSVVWLFKPFFNVLLEALYQRAEDVTAPQHTDGSNVVTISPGVRWAYNFSTGLQIVPGIAVPFVVAPGRGSRSIFLYLSFEHPFTSAAREKARGK